MTKENGERKFLYIALFTGKRHKVLYKSHQQQKWMKKETNQERFNISCKLKESMGSKQNILRTFEQKQTQSDSRFHHFTVKLPAKHPPILANIQILASLTSALFSPPTPLLITVYSPNPLWAPSVVNRTQHSARK